MKINKTYSFEICPEELENIAKEYSKEKDSPMYIIKNDNNLYTTIISTTYQTADMLESAGKIENMSDGYCFCANPAYVKEAMSLLEECFGDHIETAEITLVNSNGAYVYINEKIYNGIIKEGFC